MGLNLRAALQSPLMWLAMTVLLYEIGQWVSRKLKTPIANPLLIAALLLCAVLLITGTTTDLYNTGGAFITLFLTPATVALAVPIYRQCAVLRRHLLPILAGALTGSLASMGSVYIMCRLFGLDNRILASLLPKSVTTPIGVELSASLGGIPSITVLAIVITGLFGAVILPVFLPKVHVTHPVAIGIAMGTAAHAVGTARAVQMGETEGAMSGLAIGIAGLMTAIIVSIAMLFQ